MTKEPSWWRDLDAGLKEGYGEASAARHKSMLARLEEASGPVPRVLLRDTPSHDTPVVKPRGNGGTGRYQVFGEIARGGVGVILKGRDIDLGRDVAMKVIRAEHAASKEILQRFVEEAQIGGQLQHPGIVPVYELGLRDDDRVFFTMKLIKGETLAALLKARPDPARDRRRFLSIFEQVCHTVAYAHARGVVHRDLKPANVMVGAFGEVQVVDWGFAKVLARGPAADGGPEAAETDVRTVRTGSTGSESRAGSVLGTPAYMPPEQALGQSERVDQRSDVFALGAMLCEILTGAPPYTRPGTEIFVQAAQGDLDEALARLARCQADDELVDLARGCLSRTPEERPADAGAVADAIGRHLASVEERARRAAVEAAEAKVRAHAERKARKLTVGIAAAVLIAIVVGAGALVWIGREQRTRTQHADRSVSAALAEATTLLAEAQRTRYKDLGRWESALSAARRALELATEAAPETLARARAFLTEVEAGAERARSNATLMARLEETRAQRGDERDLQKADRTYTEVFRALGIEEQARDATAQRIHATEIAAELIAALDEWIGMRGRAGLPVDHLLAVARTVDTDAWRNELRTAGVERDHDRLLTLEASLPAGALEGNTVSLLALHLASVGERERAVGLLRRAQRTRPNDFWLSYLLGYELTLLVPAQWQESIHFFRTALAVRPHSVQARHQLGIALFKNAQTEEAIAVWEDALRLDPDFVHLYDHVAEGHEKNGTLAGLLARYRQECERTPGDWRCHFRLGRAAELSGDWDEVIAAYLRALDTEPESPLLWTHLGRAYMFHYKLENSHELSLQSHRRALELDPDCVEAWSGMTWTYWVAGEMEKALDTNAREIELNPYRPLGYSSRATLSRVRGDLTEAEKWHEKALEVAPEFTFAHVNLGQTLEVKGDFAAAIETVGRALELPMRWVEGRYYIFLVQGENPKTGEIESRPFLESWGDRDGVTLYLSQLCKRAGELEESVGILERLLETGVSGRAGDEARRDLLDSLARMGEWERAVPHVRLLLKENPGDLIGQFMLAHALLGLREFDEGEKQLRAFAQRDDWPDAKLKQRFAEQIPTFVECAREVAAVRAGRKKWGSPREEMRAGELCLNIGLQATAARLYAQAFEASPALAEERLPFHYTWYQVSAAVLAAIDAGNGIGADAASTSPAERRRWRDQALDWIRKDIAVREKVSSRAESRHTLVYYTRVGPCTLMRGSNLEQRSADERAAWEQLWADIRALRESLRKDSK